MSIQAEANLSALIESTEDLLGSVDLDYRLLTFNGAFRKHIENLFGVCPKLGMRPQDMLTPERAALWPPLFQRALADGPFRLEYPLEDGRTLELAFNPIVSDGATTGISVFGKDITERKAAEDSRRFLATIVESSQDAIFTYSPAGNLLTWNRGAEVIFGYSADEAIGKPFPMLVPPPTMATVDQYTQEVMTGQTLYGKAGMGVRKDGGLIHVSVTSWPLRNAAGAVEAVSVIARDVTIQHEAEKAQGLLASIVESSLEAIHAIDLDGKVVSWNRGAECLTGYSSDEILGKHVATLIPPEDRHNVGARIEVIKQGRTLEPIEIVLLRKDGGRVDVSLTGSPIRNAQGAIVGTSAIVRDISQRKLLHAQLVQAEKKYREIFDGAVEGMFQSSFEGKILMANRALARMLGYDSPQDLISSVKDVKKDVWVDLREHSDFTQQLSGQDSITGFECRLRRKDNTVIWCLLSCRRVRNDDGQPLFFEGSLQDITDKKNIQTKLRHSEELYRETFEQAAVGITHTSFDARVLWGNARFAEIIGYPPEEIPGLEVERFTPLEFRPMTLGIIEPLARGVIVSTTYEKPFLRKDGNLRWAKVTVSTLRDGDGRPLHLISFVEDIQARKDAENQLALAHRELQVSEARYRSVFQTSTDLIGINRLTDGTFIDANQALLDTLGYKREEVIGHSSLELAIWVDPVARQNFVELARYGSPRRNLEAAFRKKNGEIFSCLVSASALEVDGVPCVISSSRDISGAKEAEERIRNLAFFDPLTGLPNRRLLLDRLQGFPDASASVRRKIALLFIDLDNFKSWNESLGLSAGDFLLQEVARRLTACVREYDTVARVGGDEFVVMLQNLSESVEDAASQARIVSEKILATLAEPFQFAGRECHCSSSLGINVFGNEPDNNAAALQRAEIAMYQAKEAGRNTARFFAPAQQAAVNARAALEEQLRLAVRNSQFVFHYQPQIERGRLTGAEALIRWNHPSRGLVLPDHFIPLAEETGLVLQIGEWGLNTACTQLAEWSRRKETSSLALAVNISARHLHQPGFVKQVLAILDHTGARPGNLRLELTESMLSRNIEETIAIMTELKSHGLRFSIDDFGTGYSSLSYLKRLPISR